MEVLPCRRADIKAEVNNPAIRDALWFGLYTGTRRDEVPNLRWERVDLTARVFRVEETRTGVPLELPLIRQQSAILERRRAESEDLPEGVRAWYSLPSPARRAMSRTRTTSMRASRRRAARPLFSLPLAEGGSGWG